MAGDEATTPLIERARLRNATLPGWWGWVWPAAHIWTLGYGALRLYWLLAGTEVGSSPGRSDLVVFTGWWAVALCAAAAMTVLALATAKWSRVLAVGGWFLAGGLVAATALILLDLVGLILPGIAAPVDLAASASRLGCLIGGLLVGATTLSYQRHWRGACVACGRTGDGGRSDGVQWWAWVGVGVAIAGCLLRLIAQLAVGFGTGLTQGGASVVLFEVGFILAGTALPLALVCRWGRISPAWLPVMACRKVPRWLVLAPGLGLGVGMTTYFGLTLAMVAEQTLTDTWEPVDASLPLWFFWVAVPGYLMWGLGLTVAALSYQRATRPVCRFCRDGRD